MNFLYKFWRKKFKQSFFVLSAGGPNIDLKKKILKLMINSIKCLVITRKIFDINIVNGALERIKQEKELDKI